MRKGVELFLKYAFPCSAQSLSQGRITVSERKLLLEMARGKREIDLPLVEKAFAPASRRIKTALKKKSLAGLTPAGVRGFFFGAHNKRVSALPFPPAVREWCSARKAKILGVAGRKLKVECNRKVFAVANEWVEGVKRGDAVAIHRNYAVEKI